MVQKTITEIRRPSIANIMNNHLNGSTGGNNNNNNNNVMNSSSNNLHSSISNLSLSSSISDDQHGSGINIGDVANTSTTTYGSDLNSSGIQHSKISEAIDIVVIGDEMSNKARFISTFLNNGIGEDPTSIDVTCKKSVMIQSGTYTVNIHSTVGQEDFWGINDVYYRQGAGFIFVYNVHSRESFNLFLKLRDKIVYDKGSDNILMSIVGLNNEGGGEIREVSFTEAKRMADLYSCSFTEMSSFGRDCEQSITSCVSDLLGRITNFQTSLGSNANNNGGAAGSSGNGNGSHQQSLEVLMLGDIFVGKTQIIQRLLGNPFNPIYRETTDWNKNVYQQTLNDTRYLIKIVDTSGLNIEDQLDRERLVNSQGFILVYSVCSRQSFQLLESLKKKVLACKSDSKIPCILIGNKGDSVVRQVTYDEGSKLAQQWGCQFFEISAVNSEEENIGKAITQLVSDIQKASNNIELGEFKKKGYLLKEGKKLKSMSKYYFKIYKGNLQYCKNENNKSKIKTIELSEHVQVHTISNGEKKDVWPFQVIIDPLKQTHINLIATNEAERDSWVTTIKLNCYVNEAIGNLVDDVVKTMVTEIAMQEKSTSHFKKTDSSSSFPSSPISTPTKQHPSSSNNTLNIPHHHSHSNSSNSNNNASTSPSTPFTPQELKQQLNVLLSNSNNNSNHHDSTFTSSLYGDPNQSLDHNSKETPMSPSLHSSFKKNLLQRTTSFTKGKNK